MKKENDLLKKVSNVLDGFKIKHCLMFGSLLGIVRDNTLFEKNDIDFGIFDQFWKNDNLWHSFVIHLKDNGLRIKDMSFNYICIDDYTANHVDLYLLIRDSNEYIVKVTGIIAHFPHSDFDTLSDTEYLGKKYLIPNNIEDHLARNYGIDWRIAKSQPDNTNSRTSIDNYEKITYTYIVSIEKNT